MPKIKISHPAFWYKHGHWGYEHHFPSGIKKWDDYEFDINTDSACDFWVIHDQVTDIETTICDPGKVIWVPSEEKPQILEYPQEYINQFAAVITSRSDINHPKIIKTHYLSPWRVFKTYDQIYSSIVEKTADLSAIISNNISNTGHIKRYAFINKLKGHFKNKLDWFCKGEKFIEDKWDGLAHYKYSIAIENSSIPNYFTEKILDCYLANTVPIYWGCPNIGDFFPPDSFIELDINDFEASVLKIEKAIASNFYEQNQDALKKSKELVLNHYQFIPALAKIIDQLPSEIGKKKAVTIKSIQHFQKDPIVKRIIGKIYRSL